MDLVLISSISLRLIAAVLSIALLIQLRDWRMGFLTLMLLTMAVRQTLTLLAHQGANVSRLWSTEVPGLLVSVMALLSIFFLQRMLKRERKSSDSLREKEAYLRAIFDAAEVGIMMVTMDGRIIQSNAFARECLGYTKGELEKLTLPDIMHPEDFSEFKDLLQSGQGGQGPGIEKRCIRKDGSHLWGQTSVAPMFDQDGRMTHMVTVTTDITQRKLNEEALLESREHLRLLSRRLEEIQETERRSIAQEIHDDLGQTLTVLKMDLAWFRGRLLPEQSDLNTRAGSMSDLIDSSLIAIRRIMDELQPLVLDLGLAHAIKWHAKEFTRRTGCRCDVTVVGEAFDEEPNRDTAIFRTFQEALTNIMRHSNAGRVSVRLENTRDLISLEIVDDGIGIKSDMLTSGKTLGLLGMRERALTFNGEARIGAAEAGGTRVTLKVPVSLEKGLPEAAQVNT